MLPKQKCSCFCLFFCFLGTVSASDKVSKASLTSVVGDKTPQLADQTFNINWGLGDIELNLLADIKAKIDLGRGQTAHFTRAEC